MVMVMGMESKGKQLIVSCLITNDKQQLLSKLLHAIHICVFLAVHHHITFLNPHSPLTLSITNDFNFLLSYVHPNFSGFVIHTKLQSWQQRAKQKTPIIQDV